MENVDIAFIGDEVGNHPQHALLPLHIGDHRPRREAVDVRITGSNHLGTGIGLELGGGIGGRGAGNQAEHHHRFLVAADHLYLAGGVDGLPFRRNRELKAQIRMVEHIAFNIPAFGIIPVNQSFDHIQVAVAIDLQLGGVKILLSGRGELKHVADPLRRSRVSRKPAGQTTFFPGGHAV